MILVNERTYYETLEILRGQKKLAPIYRKLSNWLKKEYQITALNFELQKMKHITDASRYRLYIMLSSPQDYGKMFDEYNYDSRIQSEIAKKLYELALKYHLPDLGHYQNVFVAYSDFLQEIRADYNYRAFKLIEKDITSRYSAHSVWYITAMFSDLYVFYQSDSDIAINKENGVSKRIKDEYYNMLHQVDEFSVFTYENFHVSFDSKENLDKNFEGNLYYYFK